MCVWRFCMYWPVREGRLCSGRAARNTQLRRLTGRHLLWRHAACRSARHDERSGCHGRSDPHQFHEAGSARLWRRICNISIVDGILGARRVSYDQCNGGWIDDPRLGLTDDNYDHAYGGRVLLRFMERVPTSLFLLLHATADTPTMHFQLQSVSDRTGELRLQSNKPSAFHRRRVALPPPGHLLRSEPLQLPGAAHQLRILFTSTDGVAGQMPVVVSARSIFLTVSIHVYCTRTPRRSSHNRKFRQLVRPVTS
jgi:hypothetical protein